MEKIELLAPAGEWDSLRAAVENGADAVYLGGKLFNARQYAGNFDIDELKRAAEYAHIRGVSLYLTMNTLVADEELKAALEFASQAYLAGIDGLIVQDIGLASALRRLLPDLPLHASTQMTIYNTAGADYLKELGFKRVVLARELSLEEIKNITKSTSIEVEVFIHGALCISYSGQCLMSSIIGGRSGNRGRCAQPCRLPYQLLGPGGKAAEGYLMSPKDLCGVDLLGELAVSGVKSLKIEGRMKSPEYVATIVRNYREYLDSAIAGNSAEVTKEDLEELLLAFNRGGFSKGYLQGKTGKDMMAYEKPKNWGIRLGTALSYSPVSREVTIRLDKSLSNGDGIEIWNDAAESPGTVVSSIKAGNNRVNTAEPGTTAVVGYVDGNINKGSPVHKTSDRTLNERAKESYQKTNQRVKLFGSLDISADQPVKLEVRDDSGSIAAIEGVVPEKAINRPLDSDKVLAQMSKTGGTPFCFENLEIKLDEGLSVPASALNDIRRKALEKLEMVRAARYIRRIDPCGVEKELKSIYFPGNSRRISDGLLKKSTRYSVLVQAFNRKNDYSNIKADRVYLPFEAFIKDGERLIDSFKVKNIELYCWLPPITRGTSDKLISDWVLKTEAMKLDGILAGNPGTVHLRKVFKGNITADFSMNIFNTATIKALSELGLTGATLSPELDMGRIEKLEIPEGIDIEAVVYGRLPLMTSEYCPIGALAGGHCTGAKCNGVCSKGEYRLKDRKGIEFPLLTDRIDCRSTVLNSSILFVPDLQRRLIKAQVDIMRLNMFDETVEEMNEILELYRDVAAGSVDVLKRSVVAERIREKGHTKGHYLRGVE